MKKILSTFALVLFAITLSLGLVGCKKIKKQNRPEYIVSKTYKFKSFEGTGFEEEAYAQQKETFSATTFTFTENKVIQFLDGRETPSEYFYKMNKYRRLTLYKNEDMKKPIDSGYDFLEFSFYFYQDYKTFFFKITDSNAGTTAKGTFVVD